MRASKFLLLGLLALFSLTSFATVIGDYSNKAAATSACSADVAIHNSINETDIECYVTPNELVGYAKYNNNYYNYSDCSPFKIVSGDYCITPPTDQECQARTDEPVTQKIILSTGSYSETFFDGGCLMAINLIYENGKNKCYLTDDPDILECEGLAFGLSADSSPDSAGVGPGGSAFGDQIKGGDLTTTTTNSPETTETDTPNPGDTTTTKTETKEDVFTEKTEVSGDEPMVVVEKTYKGGITTTTTTTTIQNADGTTTETVHKAYSQTPSGWSKQEINTQSGTSTTTSGSTPGSSGTSTTTTNKDSSGNTTDTSTNSTGTQPNGNTAQQQFDLTGNCAPGEECKVTLNAEGLEDINTTKSKIDAIKDSITVKEGELISSIVDDESNNYGIDNVTDFSSNTFISKYFTMPSPTCSGGINTTIFGRPFVIEPCQKLQPLRDVLAWVFFILTAFTVIRISFRKVV